MEWIIDNWFIGIGLIAILAVAIVAVKMFWDLPTPAQIVKIKEWLLWAVSKAEYELGEGTGALKLRYVYDAFVDKFPMAAKIISFETFAKWVDEALDKMRELLSTNEKVAELIAPVEPVEEPTE